MNGKPECHCQIPFEEMFVRAFNVLSVEAHMTAVEKGWHANRRAIVEACTKVSPDLGRAAKLAVDGQTIALVQSELSEALEGLRHGNPPDDKVPAFTAQEAEFADVIIRIMDTAVENRLRIGEAVVAKMAMNRGRERMHGGKSF